MNRPDPYADLDEVYASEVSRARLPRVHPTAKTPTDDDTGASHAWFWTMLPEDQQGYHIDGDPRYWER